MHMKVNQLVPLGIALGVALASLTCATASAAREAGTRHIRHVLLLSIDGMHAVDLYNCAHGIAGVNYGSPYCPNLAKLSATALNYVAAVASKPSTWRMTDRLMPRRRRPAQASLVARARPTEYQPARRPTTTKASTSTITR